MLKIKLTPLGCSETYSRPANPDNVLGRVPVNIKLARLRSRCLDSCMVCKTGKTING
jgi:hypothetical protein